MSEILEKKEKLKEKKQAIIKNEEVESAKVVRKMDDITEKGK